MRSCFLVLAAALSLASTATAQTPSFHTPGMPRLNYGQTDQFTNDFNPAFGLVLDSFASYKDVDGGESGLDLYVRSFETTFNAYADPRLWSYAVVVADPEEGEIEVEEAAAMWIGWDGNATLKAGRFFVDFGKQMQAHVHDLAYFDRPLVLENYLGEELAGTGVQFDNWFPAGDSTAIRYSIGVFDSLLAGGHGHGEEEGDDGDEPETLQDELADLDDLSFTTRVTGFTDVGEYGVFQFGASLRSVPNFSFGLDSSGDTASGLSQNVYGVDLTYGTTDDTGLAGWTFGTEYLIFDGDVGAETNDAGTPDDGADDTVSVLDESLGGYYLWAERDFDQFQSAGLLYSAAELPEPGTPEDSKITAYYTRNLSEFTRLRFGVELLDSDAGADETAFVVQLTNWLGPHAHGLNW